MKYVVVTAAMLLSVGCASKGDLSALSTRVDTLESQHRAIETEHVEIKADHESIKGEVSDLSAKMDRAFAKGRK